MPCSCKNKATCDCRENYSPSQKIGDMTQSDFDVAFRRAVKRMRRTESRMTGAMVISTIIWLILIIWAVLLAMQVRKEDRVLHLVLALVFGPLYIIAHYLGCASHGKGMSGSPRSGGSR